VWSRGAPPAHGALFENLPAGVLPGFAERRPGEKNVGRSQEGHQTNPQSGIWKLDRLIEIVCIRGSWIVFAEVNNHEGSVPFKFDRQSGNSRFGSHARPASLITGLLFRAIVTSNDLLLSPIVLPRIRWKEWRSRFWDTRMERMMMPSNTVSTCTTTTLNTPTPVAVASPPYEIRLLRHFYNNLQESQATKVTCAFAATHLGTPPP
jgi:hypothetical protein